jgi:transcriptional regulator with XRE-family HTH domain
MKEKDGYVNCPEQQVILYVEKEDGQYGPMQTGSYLSGNYLDDYEIKRVHLEESLRTRVLKGEISMVKYYMILEDLTLSELAARVGLSKTNVNRHLDPVHFGKAKVETLKKYADVFNVPISNMLQVVMLKKGDNFESYTVLEEKKQTEGIEQVKTVNPYVMLVKIGEKIK